MEQQSELSTISNELTAALPALVFEGKIVVVDSEEQVEAACRDIESYAIVGFDTETRPSFKAGVTYKVSLLQLSTPTSCYLFRLHKIPLLDPIRKILESHDILKIGADVAGDIRSINQLFQIDADGFYDLQSYIWEWGVGEKSLRKMSALVLGYRISKAQRLSNWEASTLTKQQQIYAATDAWACTEIYNRLQQMAKLSPEQIAILREEQRQRAAEAAAKKAAKAAAKEEREASRTGEAGAKRNYRRRNHHRRRAKSSEAAKTTIEQKK
ncbi:MAG: 3'-5' exonuclease [Rikenellaceae bacterium]